ncbi:MAG: UDP-N-acetylglucosamine--N-acetylmuramyl-(pentapeptide) pyrophosphoryl-undecaprenol N-acetylglucosamine transferase, partial [Betaproteobacteria bacterium]|nr:UDP-N-acetylglucosamine--N-acetylmuramyl-(pentapeptide) pyrophosphoryl-undecaprenol N-acetylglucosamine transferase [Betaproteobacteria bacterium]
NARFLSDRGAALLLPQSQLTPEKLAQAIGSLDRTALLAMAKKARELGKPDAAAVVAQRCIELARRKAA